uniref:YfeC-like transcriptional regulator n=3 Tax=Paramuribaculum intestinale TaxID=2094151 RepID=UPI0026F38F88
MAELTNTQKKEWAKSLYLRESMTQQELANRVGVSRVTISNWIRDGKWEEYKAGLTLTRKEQVNNLYRQVAEINRQIAERPEGERFANSKEADILGKLSSSIARMEQEMGIADKISVLTDFVEWLRALDVNKAKEIVSLDILNKLTPYGLFKLTPI